MQEGFFVLYCIQFNKNYEVSIQGIAANTNCLFVFGL